MHVVFALEPGGMELGVVKLVNGMDPARVASSICSTRPASALTHLLPPDVPMYELRRRPGTDPRLVWQLYSLFRAERPDVVHTHAWGTLIEGLVGARLAGVPIVIHGEHGTLQLKPYQRWLQRRAWTSADQVLAVSSRLADRMARETGFDRTRIMVIRNGVDLTRFGALSRSAARNVLGLRAEATVIGSVGRLVPVKDHATLLEAFALLRREGLEATLALAGEGPERAALEARTATLGLERDVRFLGHRSDVETVLAALDIFVLSSVSEGLSNTILEAMAAGLPVVATRVGGADELVQERVTGLLTPAASPSEMADAIAQLARDSGRRLAMGAAGRRHAETEFALSSMVARYESLYLQLGRISSNGRTRHRH